MLLTRFRGQKHLLDFVNLFVFYEHTSLQVKNEDFKGQKDL